MQVFLKSYLKIQIQTIMKKCPLDYSGAPSIFVLLAGLVCLDPPTLFLSPPTSPNTAGECSTPEMCPHFLSCLFIYL